MNAPDPTTTTFEALWDASDLAAFLKCSRKTVYNRSEAGLIPCVRIGALLRFEPETIRKWVRGELPAAPGARVVPLQRASHAQ